MVNPEKSFSVGATIQFDLETMSYIGEYDDPSTYTQITIVNPSGAKEVDGASMSKKREGFYNYSWDSTGKEKGRYTVTYETSDAGVLTPDIKTFCLV